jgi:hypothetical protein
MGGGGYGITPSSRLPRRSRESGDPRGSVRVFGTHRLFQPFPHRLIDDFIAAYNERHLDTLENLVDVDQIEDVVAAAYAGHLHL